MRIRLIYYALAIAILAGCGGDGGQTANNSVPADAWGTAVNADQIAGRFTINPVAKGTGPIVMGSSVNVVTSSSTAFFDLGGHPMTAPQFFVAMAANSFVKASGMYLNGTLTASEAKLSLPVP